MFLTLNFWKTHVFVDVLHSLFTCCILYDRNLWLSTVNFNIKFID
jgi:hypothetical protein